MQMSLNSRCKEAAVNRVGESSVAFVWCGLLASQGCELWRFITNVSNGDNNQYHTFG